MEECISQKKPKIEGLIRNKCISLGEEVSKVDKIYLDTRFWIHFRDVVRNGSSNVEHFKIYSILRNIVASGRAFCPVGDTILYEILKQTDSKSRKASAVVIDDLSRGISMIDSEMRINTEISHLIHALVMPENLHPLNNLIWTKICFILGPTYPIETAFDKEMEEIVQENFLEHFWTADFKDLIASYDDYRHFDAVFDANMVESMNLGCSKHSFQVKSFEGVYDIELMGVLDLYKEFAKNVVGAIKKKLMLA